MASYKYNSHGKNSLLKVVILGDGGVGKSCLMNRFVNNHFQEVSFHTIGVEFLNKELTINNDLFTLQIWDTAGQERFKSLRTPFYRGSDVCMLTFAVDDLSSFQNLAMWKKEFLFYADIKEGAFFPFIVVANKIDIGDENRRVTEAQARQWCEENGKLPYIEASAKDAVNVDKAFTMAVEIWSKMEELMDRQGHYQEDTVKLSNGSLSTNDGCCGRK